MVGLDQVVNVTTAPRDSPRGGSFFPFIPLQKSCQTFLELTSSDFQCFLSEHLLHHDQGSDVGLGLHLGVAGHFLR